MDNQQSSTNRELLRAKIREALVKAGSLSLLNRFVIEQLLESSKASEDILQNLFNQLEKFIQDEEKNYQIYKQNMLKAAVLYKKSLQE